MRCPLHPLFWLPVFIALYGTWYYLWLVSLGLEVSEHDELFLFYHVIAMVSVSTPLSIILKQEDFDGIRLRPVNFLIDKSVSVIFFLLISFYFLIVLVSGASSKRAIKDGLTGSISIIAAIALIGLMIMAIRAIAVQYYCKERIAVPITYFLFFATAAFLIVGEREVLFGLGLLWFLVSASQKKRRNTWIYFYSIVLAGVAAAAASQGLKAALVGEINWSRVFFESIFYSEFSAPGRNFSYLKYATSEDIRGFLVVAAEFKRVVLSFLPGAEAASMSEWFNKTYRVNLEIGGRSGWGFTLVGSAFLAGGGMGVAAYFTVVGLLLSLLVKNIKKYDVLAISYLCIIPTLIYALRQDFSYLANYYIKYALIFNFLLAGISTYLAQNFPKTKRTRHVFK